MGTSKVCESWPSSMFSSYPMGDAVDVLDHALWVLYITYAFTQHLLFLDCKAQLLNQKKYFFVGKLKTPRLPNPLIFAAVLLGISFAFVLVQTWCAVIEVP